MADGSGFPPSATLTTQEPIRCLLAVYFAAHDTLQNKTRLNALVFVVRDHPKTDQMLLFGLSKYKWRCKRGFPCDYM